MVTYKGDFYYMGKKLDIHFKNGEWVDSKGRSFRKHHWRKTTCARCGNLPTEEGYDSCIGFVPGVIKACCGHGSKAPYVKLPNNKIIKGKGALKILHKT
jgi:hypothetical protein